MIEVEELTHRYDDTVAVKDVSLRIEDGAFILITGANGSGKTTLVRHFNGLLEPTAGRVSVDGKDVQSNPVIARTSVGMVFQEPSNQFVASTVGTDVAFGPENLGLDRSEIERRVDVSLTAVNMDGRETDRIDSLSGGERARVAIAGVLAMEPSYLVFDEPFTGLDQPARESLLEHLDSLSASGTGIIVVTHDLRDLIDRADRLIGLVDGEVVVDGRPREMLDTLAEIHVRSPEV